MDRQIRLLLAIVVLTATTLHAEKQAPQAFASSAMLNRAAAATYGNLPLSFEPNLGQSSGEVRFLSRGKGYSLFLTGSKAVLASQGKHPDSPHAGAGRSSPSGKPRGTSPEARAAGPGTLEMTLLGANPSATAVGVDELRGKINYFIGNDPRKWRTNVPTYAKVKYRNIYPGVDLIYYGNQNGELEYDFVVAPGTDPAAIAFLIDSDLESSATNRVPPRLNSDGDLVLDGKADGVRFQKPIVYQEGSGGQKHFIDGRYTVRTTAETSSISFLVSAYDHSKPLVIDPAIVYSTSLGGTIKPGGYVGSNGNGMAVFTDPTGHVYAYIAGGTCASDFPVVNARQPVFSMDGFCGDPSGIGDAFVTKFDPSASGNASVLYSTYLGGGSREAGTGIAVDSGGNAYVSGWTQSTDFPTANAYQSANRSSQNAFMAKLSSDGSTLLYSTYFGGSGGETASAISLAPTGYAYIAGGTSSPDLPTLNPYQAYLGSGGAFLAAFDTTRSGIPSLVYSSYFGSGGTAALALSLDGSGAIHLAGAGGSVPVMNAYQASSLTGSGAAFYARLNPGFLGAAQLTYSTYLGGSGDQANGVAADPSGNAYISGLTGSGLFPVTTGVAPPPADPGLNSYGLYAYGLFVTKLNPLLPGPGSLVFSRAYDAMTWKNAPTGISIDSSGHAFFAGSAFPGLELVNPTFSSANGVLQSTNGGQTWTVLNQGLTEFPILALAVDASTSPRTIYAGTGRGSVFASADGGANWNRVLQVPSTNSSECQHAGFIPHLGATSVCVMALAVDPSAPSNVYAGTTAGIYKSSDRGATWIVLNDGLTQTALQGIQALQFDDCRPQCSSPSVVTLYAGAEDGLYKLNPGETSWVHLALATDIASISVDTATLSHTLFVTGPLGEEYRSTDGGATWTLVTQNYANGSIAIYALGVDTRPIPSTLYEIGYGSNGYDTEIAKSVDGGNTWILFLKPGLGYLSHPPMSISVDTTTTPSTVYAEDSQSGIVSSSDGGDSWQQVLTGFGVYTPNPAVIRSSGTLGSPMALDTTTSPPTIYTASGVPFANAFIAELDPSGSTFLFSTYLGEITSDSYASGIAIDGNGNIYVTGAVGYPLTFPRVNAFQIPTASSDQGAFLTVLGNPTLPASSSGSVTSQVGVQNGTLAVTLPNITGSSTGSSPTLTVDPVSSTTTANYGISNNLGAYDISTTATFSGSVTLCFQAQTVNDLTTFNNLELFHIVEGASVNITSSHDFATRTVCGTTTSLSPFVLFSPTSSTLLTTALQPATYGQSVTFTANVVSAGAATGNVTFKDGNTVLGTVPLSAGQASFTTASLGVGAHSITAAYSGDALFLASTSAAVTESVNQAATSVALTVSANPSILNQGITFTATVNALAPGSGSPTGSVTFLDGSTVLATKTLSAGTVTFTTSSLKAGSHSITATYGGDPSFMASAFAGISQIVQYQPSGTTCLAAAAHQILQPINSDGTSVWKQGRTIPAQFRVCDANGVSIGTASVVSSFLLTKIIAGTVTNVDESVSSTTSDAAFRWDATNQQWIFNISTKSLAANNTYMYTITLNDGTAIGFQYGLK